MADSAQPSGEGHKCAVCGIGSEERVLLSGEQKGEPVYVCVRCLPALIHGGH